MKKNMIYLAAGAAVILGGALYISHKRHESSETPLDEAAEQAKTNWRVGSTAISDDFFSSFTAGDEFFGADGIKRSAKSVIRTSFGKPTVPYKAKWANNSLGLSTMKSNRGFCPPNCPNS